MAGRSNINREAGLCAKGLHPWIEGQKQCKICQLEPSRKAKSKYSTNNPEKVSAAIRNWAKVNPEKVRAAGRKRDRRVRLEKFGLTPEDVLVTCQVCGRDNGSKKLVCVDHDHATGRFRGFLCDRCNKILGFAQDDPNLLEKLVLYLRERV